jgi:hypothetical protein
MQLVRPPKSAAEIATLPAIASTECTLVLSGAGHAFDPETLVYVIREAVDVRKTELVQVAALHLMGAGEPTEPGSRRTPAEKVIWAVARRFGFSSDLRILDEFWRACLDAMWDALLAGREEKPFWEANFGQALFAKCLDVGRPLYRRWKKEVPMESVPTLQGVDVSGDLLARLGEEAILQAIRRLPTKEAHAAMLHWVDGRPVDSPEPGSVMNVMKLSARQVHNLLSSAQGRLARDPVVRDLREAS